MGNVLKMLGGFVVLSMLIGVLGAGLAIPAVGALGSTVNSGVTLFDELPDDLAQGQINQQSKILDASGKVIATPYSENRIIVPLDQVAPIMQKAQVAIEDNRFYEHGGVDLRGLTRAMMSTLMGDKQGASTLTQQYVRMTLQANARNKDDAQAAADAGARNGVEGVARKLRELKLAVALEQRMSKSDILSGYLNLAYYGDQAYGIEAASEHYFSIPASKLNYLQAALLAGTVQTPSDTDPVNNPEAAFHRRNVVLDRMTQLGVITPKQAADGKKVPIKKMLKVQQPKNTCQRSPEPYFCQYVIAWLQEQPSLGTTPAQRLRLLNTGGLTVQTTLKSDLSAKMLGYLKAKVPIGDSSKVGAAATVVEPGTGKVLGMAQTSKFSGKGRGVTQVSWNVDQKYGGTLGQQFGSTGKLFVLVDALSSGIPMNGSVFAKKAGPRTPATYLRSDNNPSDACRSSVASSFEVRNDYNDGGNAITLRRATGASINTAFMSLALELGICSVRDTATKLGMHQGDGKPMQKFATSVTLGAGDTTPMTLASAYATIAADGVYCTPVPVVSVKGPDKKVYKVATAGCKPVIDKDVARGVAELLKAPLSPGGTAAGNTLDGGRPAAGKTGTTDSHVETWFAGFTPQLATAVWVGTPYDNKSMANRVIGGRSYGQIFGATLAAPLWRQIMSFASQGMPFEQFPQPSSQIANGNLVALPSVIGMSYDQAKATLEAAGFSAYNAGNVDSPLPKGAVVSTSPSGSAVAGQPIGLFLSSGVNPKTPGPTKTKPNPGATKKPGG